jgi:hypothetical protein
VQDADPKNDSVYDFLYYDRQRVGSFLAQFDNSGHLQQIIERETAQKATKRGFKINVGGGATVLGTGGQGNLGVERGPDLAGSEGSERIYDPIWSNALTLLDYLHGAELISRDITATRLGQFVIASGSLTVLNATIMRETWVSPKLLEVAIKQAVANAKTKWNADPANAALKGENRTRAERLAVDATKANAEISLGNLKYYPHSINCIINGINFSVWSPLHEVRPPISHLCTALKCRESGIC